MDFEQHAIFGLVCGIIVLLIVARRILLYHARGILLYHEVHQELKDSLYLSKRGWRCVQARTDFLPSFWESPDNDKEYSFGMALKRQRELDRIHDLDLPEKEPYQIGGWMKEYE